MLLNLFFIPAWLENSSTLVHLYPPPGKAHHQPFLNTVYFCLEKTSKFSHPLSEYACAQAIMMSQTQVDFKAGEYINPAYIAYVQEQVTKATLQEAEVWEIMEIG